MFPYINLLHDILKDQDPFPLIRMLSHAHPVAHQTCGFRRLHTCLSTFASLDFPRNRLLARAIAFEIYSSCRAARTMSRRKSVSQPARLSLPRMESLSGCTRAIFRASRRNSARLDGPWSLRLR